MRFPAAHALALLVAVAASAVACDRGMEPYVEGEKPSKPDLRKIFPPGAEQVAKSNPPMGQAQVPAADRGAPPSMAASQQAAAAGQPSAAAAGQPSTAAAGPEGAVSTAPVRGRIVLAPELAGRAPRTAVLFIIARRGAGGPPLAVKRIEAPGFPLDFTLGPDDRMIQTLPFAGPLQLTARLDGDGNATTRTAGDLQGAAPAPVEPGADNVEIVLGEVL